MSRRRMAVIGGGMVIIHSLASDDISGTMLQLDSGLKRLSWDPIGPIRRLTLVWRVIQLTLLAGLSTETAVVPRFVNFGK